MQQQPPGSPDPRWSPDGRFWWDGVSWVPVSRSPLPAPPPASWGFDLMVFPTGALTARAPSPGLRQFLIVMLVLTDVVTGFFALVGLFALAGDLGIFGATPESGAVAGTVGLLVFSVLLFALTTIATIGVARRSSWAQVMASIAGVAVSLTCFGLVLGIPIVVAASRAPLRKAA
jgi:hypothetical protein